MMYLKTSFWRHRVDPTLVSVKRSNIYIIRIIYKKFHDFFLECGELLLRSYQPQTALKNCKRHSQTAREVFLVK